MPHGSEVITLLISAGMAFLISAWLTGPICRFALERGMIDVPNRRSAHERPVPRGGGLAVAAAVLGTWTAGAVLGWVDRRFAIAAGFGGAVVAAVGWIDDKRGLGPLVRLSTQLFAAGWAVTALTWPEFAGWASADWLALGRRLVSVVCVVWLINLYNFMDGIDGLAAGQAIAVGGIGTLLAFGTGADATAVASVAIAGAAAGFLRWNWPPARIFLGDVGSGFLGFGFATIAIDSARGGGPPLAAWGILLMPFLFDASATLLRRIGRGDVWYRAHRLHAYQRAALGGLGHRAVTQSVLLLNLGLGILATGVTVGWLGPSIGLVASAIVAAVLYGWVERRWPM